MAEILGFGSGGQAMISYREKAPDEQGARSLPGVEEICRFEDAVGIQRGTVLRRAGYVVDAGDPLDQIQSWTWLAPALREAITRIVQPEWVKRLRGAPLEERSRTRGRGARSE